MTPPIKRRDRVDLELTLRSRAEVREIESLERLRWTPARRLEIDASVVRIGWTIRVQHGVGEVRECYVPTYRGVKPRRRPVRFGPTAGSANDHDPGSGRRVVI